MSVLALVEPIVVRVVETVPREPTVADILIQALGLTGALLLGAALLGFVLGGLFILLKKLRPQNPLNGEPSDLYRLKLDSSSR